MTSERAEDDAGAPVEDYLTHKRRMDRIAHVEEDCIVINIEAVMGREDGETRMGDPKYQIPLRRIKTAEEILAWIDHLCGKTWVTTELIDRLIVVATGANDIRLPNA